jgi:hypothetical protein
VKHRARLLTVAVAGFFCLCGSALADDIVVPDNTNCPGNNCFGTLGLLYFTTPDSTTATIQTLNVVLTLGTGSMTGVGRSPATEAVHVVSSVTDGLAAGWTEMDGWLSSCDSTGSGLVCAENLARPLTGLDRTKPWGPDMTVQTAALLTGSLQASVDGLYRDAGFDQNGIKSEDASPRSVPKLGWMLFYCASLLGLAAYKLRRHRQRW